MIDARRLRVLREVAEHGTVAAAADALHLTPSAVSQQLAALEREVGQPVVERNGRGVRLTGAAEVLVGHANVVLAQLEAAAADVAAYADGLVGTVGSPASPRGSRRSSRRPPRRCASPIRGSGSRSPSRRHPGASSPSPAATSTWRSRWPRGWRRRSTTRAYERLALRVDPLDAVLPATHPRAGDDAVDLAALASEPFIGPPDGTSCHDVTVNGCAAAGFTPGFAHRSLDYHATMALVAAGLGVALVPRLGQAVVPPGVVVRPLAGPVPARHVFAATRAGSARRPTVAAVLDALVAAAGQRPPTL